MKPMVVPPVDLKKKKKGNYFCVDTLSGQNVNSLPMLLAYTRPVPKEVDRLSLKLSTYSFILMPFQTF